MILVDANLLIYAVNLNAPHHERARRWLQGHWAILRRLLRDSGTAGNLTSDAHLAALAIERGATICSADYDFRRFPGVEHVNPLDDPAHPSRANG